MRDDVAAVQSALSGRYEVEREIGRGGMAVVYLARDVKHDRAVAVKVFRPEVGLGRGTERFLREVKLTARLQHPHILPVYDSGEVYAADGNAEVAPLLYYVMPYVEGESLRDRLAREQRLPIGDALRIASEVADALGYAHAKQTIHRDVKPGNILLAASPDEPSVAHAIVADFGIARALTVASGDALTDTGAALGTPAYMSPEQILGESDIDGRSDIYSLGCVLFEMLTGRVPFSTDDGQVVVARRFTSPPPSVREVRPGVSLELEDVVMRTLARERAARFQTPRDFAMALELERRSRPLPLEVRAGSGRSLPSAVGDASRRANLGAFVSRTCNRWRQVNAFDAYFRTARQAFPGKAQFYVVHGDEGEAHESFVERLVATRIGHFASEIAGEERGTVVSLKIPWPEDDDLEICQRDLTISLFRELAPAYMGQDLSVNAVAKLASAALCSVVVVQHNVRATQWRPTTDRLMQWYVNTFWGSLGGSRGSPIFMVFVKVIYPVRRQRFPLAQWLRRGPPDKREVGERVRRIFTAPELGCPAAVLSELSSVTVDDVESWFSQNGIYQSEQRRRELAASIFQSAPSKRLAEVELDLERIHREFVRQAAGLRGART